MVIHGLSVLYFIKICPHTYFMVKDGREMIAAHGDARVGTYQGPREHVVHADPISLDSRFITAAVSVMQSKQEFANLCVLKWGNDHTQWAPNCKDTTELRMQFRAAFLPGHYKDRSTPTWLLEQAAQKDVEALSLLCTIKPNEAPTEVQKFRTAAFKAADRVLDLHIHEAKKFLDSMLVSYVFVY